MELVISASLNKLFKNSKTTKRVVFVVFVAIFILACYNVVSSYFMYCEHTLNKLDAIAKTLSIQIDGNMHQELLRSNKKVGEIKTNQENEFYYTIHKQLASAQKANNLKSDISTLVYNDSLKHFFYVVNSSPKPYYLDKYSQNHEAFLKVYQSGGMIPEYHDEYGTWLTALCPIKDSNGKVVGVIEVDERYDDFLDVIDKELYGKILIALLIFTVIAVILLRYLRQILLGEEAVKNELEHSYELINQHNEDMLNSINYAKKIQAAILPPIENIKKNIPNSFVFYLPKDIVSGDFYFFKELEIENKYLIAACDCTGHGVPGALMSVIGSNFLDHIVDENIVSPAEILTKLNQSVINTLKQDDLKSESRDGMDVAICLIDKTNNTITYAGANRPLYAVDSLGNCIETKGDKRPIGGLDNSLYKFSEHTFDLINNTNYYLFTDGFVDQFGGDKDKKFTTKRFKETLSSISKLPMNEQLIIIENAFVNWKTASAQTDDVLVIGFKVN